MVVKRFSNLTSCPAGFASAPAVVIVAVLFNVT